MNTKLVGWVQKHLVIRICVCLNVIKLTLSIYFAGVPSLRQLSLMTISSNKSLYDFTKADPKARHQIEQFNYRQGLECVFPMFARAK